MGMLECIVDQFDAYPVDTQLNGPRQPGYVVCVQGNSDASGDVCLIYNGLERAHKAKCFQQGRHEFMADAPDGSEC